MARNIINVATIGNANEVRILLSNGADVNKADKDGKTSLLHASSRGRTEVVKLLLKNGADVNKADKDGKTPLQGASEKGHAEVVKLLLENGADVNQADKDGQTPLHEASYNGNSEVAKLLLRAPGIDVNRADKIEGKTPILWASYKGHTEVVRLLLAAPGIDVNRYDNSGWAPLYRASENGKTEVVKLLLAAPGIDVNQVNNEGKTPLYVASQFGHTEVVRLLLKANANPKIINNYGKTPFDVASNRDIKTMLLKEMGLTVPYRNMNNREKKEFKPVLLKRLLVKKDINKNKNFMDPISHMNYNMRTLEPVNNNSGNTLNKVGLIIDDKNKPIRLVNYNTVNYHKQRARNGIIRGILYKDWSLIPFTKAELNKAYKDLDRVSAMAKSARTRKNLSTIRSSTSIRHRFDKAKAKNRIKRNEKKTETIASAYRSNREAKK